MVTLPHAAGEAAITMPASFVTEGMSAVRLRHTVTAAFSCISIIATGRQMTRERPITAARLHQWFRRGEAPRGESLPAVFLRYSVGLQPKAR